MGCTARITNGSTNCVSSARRTRVTTFATQKVVTYFSEAGTHFPHYKSIIFWLSQTVCSSIWTVLWRGFVDVMQLGTHLKNLSTTGPPPSRFAVVAMLAKPKRLHMSLTNSNGGTSTIMMKSLANMVEALLVIEEVKSMRHDSDLFSSCSQVLSTCMWSS